MLMGPALDLGISVKETTVFSVFHPDAHDLFTTCSDLKKVAWELCDPGRRLNDQVCLNWLLPPTTHHSASG
jgi:hypothetical protein